MRAAALLAELHHRADELLRAQDRRADVGLLDRGDVGAVGHVRGRVDDDLAAVGQVDVVLDVRRRREQLEVVLALEPLAHDVHVEQPEEAAAEAEAERLARLGLPGERGVVQRQLLERVAQVRELVRLDGEQPAEHHRLDLAVARQRLGRGAGPRGERVAHAQLRDVLDARDHVADLAGAQLVDRHHASGRRSRSRRSRRACRPASRGSRRPSSGCRRRRARRRRRRGTGRTRSRR